LSFEKKRKRTFLEEKLVKTYILSQKKKINIYTNRCHLKKKKKKKKKRW